MIVVSDTTPLRYLAVLGLLDLLPRPSNSIPPLLHRSPIARKPWHGLKPRPSVSNSRE